MTKELEEIRSFIEESRMIRSKIVDFLLERIEEINVALASSIQGEG